ncbi:MAG: hypothetical protein R2788_23780 [Saprospiraceae bacterium]
MLEKKRITRKEEIKKLLLICQIYRFKKIVITGRKIKLITTPKSLIEDFENNTALKVQALMKKSKKSMIFTSNQKSEGNIKK